MILEYLTVGPFAENSYLLADSDTREGILIDPGHDPGAILARVAELGLRITAIRNTHAHIDHVGGVEAVQAALGPLPFSLHRFELPLLEALPAQAAMFGLPKIVVPRVDHFLEDGEVFRVGGLEVQVILVPGHSPGSVAFRVGPAGWSGGGAGAPGAAVGPGAPAKDVIAGDVLFAGSIGRTDLPGGDHDTLLDSIRTRLFPLGDDTTIWPGHGPETTIGEERRYNPFVGETPRPAGW
jgi:hydroxyacylglutathione hydrolase